MERCGVSMGVIKSLSLPALGTCSPSSPAPGLAEEPAGTLDSRTEVLLPSFAVILAQTTTVLRCRHKTFVL